MKEVTALLLQTWFDISVQYTGSITNAFAIAAANNHAITDTIAGGQIIVIPADLPFLKKEFDYLKGKNIKPATDITNAAIEIIDTLGIGSMIIETNFIIG